MKHILPPGEKELLQFGFEKGDTGLTYSRTVADGQMLLTLTLDNGELVPKVTDCFDGEEYVLYKVPDAGGEFVGTIRNEVEGLLEEIDALYRRECPFSFPQTHRLIDFCRERFSTELEYPWSPASDGAVMRNPESRKWYAVVMTVPKSRLGFCGDASAEIVNLHLAPETVKTVVDNKHILPAYHMNKIHWISLCLDGTVPDDVLFALVEESYALSSRKTKRKK